MRSNRHGPLRFRLQDPDGESAADCGYTQRPEGRGIRQNCATLIEPARPGPWRVTIPHSMSAIPIALKPGYARAQSLTVTLMVVLSGLSYFDRTIMSIAAPTIMKEFGISETDMGTVFSAFLLSYTIL